MTNESRQMFNGDNDDDDAVGVAIATPAMIWGVRALLLATADALTARFGAVTVRAEIVSFTRAASGHCYFSLKDEDGAAAIKAVMFSRHAQLQRQTVLATLAEGAHVQCRGRLAVYEARGDLQLIVESITAVGVGALYEAFVRLRAALAAQGLFDAARKRAIPVWPRAVGVVTSTGGAALHDVLTALARRAPHIPVHVFACAVQGREAPAAIVAALALAGQDTSIETVILCRGGGSLEDLMAFNDERVVRAVAAQPQPIIVGVGHETDLTLAELAADLRAPTPTAAAELAATPRQDWLADLDRAQQRLAASLLRRLDSAEQRMDRAALVLQAARERLVSEQALLAQRGERLRAALRQATWRAQARLDNQAAQLTQAVNRSLERERHRLQQMTLRLQALDPTLVLRRGYVWMEDSSGQPVVSAGAVRAGDDLRAVWADGAADVQVRAVLPPASPTL